MIFLDEVQECQEAITSLKFWAIDNRYDVIASGSLLGIDYKRASSYPVGYVDYSKMNGMDFEDLLLVLIIDLHIWGTPDSSGCLGMIPVF